jgi:hypothetical protein
MEEVEFTGQQESMCSRNHGHGKEKSVLNERTCSAHTDIAVASSVGMPTSQWSAASSCQVTFTRGDKLQDRVTGVNISPEVSTFWNAAIRAETVKHKTFQTVRVPELGALDSHGELETLAHDPPFDDQQSNP